MIPAQDFTPSDSPAEAENAVLGGEESVLVVEDEEPVRTFLTTMLKGQGYTVHAAACASEAIKVWDAAGEKIDLLLTDMVLPEEINGRELAMRLLERKSHLKILVFSGYMPQDAGKDLEAFGIDFLEKPAPVDRLLKHIRTLLERKG
jgi:DNA-binding NtrC family response regulator